MEIHYFWIESFRNIKNQGITLSSKYIFITEINKESKTGQIIIKENPSFIENLFNKQNITNVSAIIGKNGAGKTSILDFILSNFPQGVSANVNNGTIVIASNQTNKFQIFVPSNWSITIKNNTNQKEIIKKYSDIDDTFENFRFTSNVSSIDYFYYNFFLDYKIDVANWQGIKNISTSTLLCLPRKSAIEERWNKHGVDETEARTFDLNFYINDEISKAIQLLVSNKRELIPFSSPKELFITISTTDYIYFSKKTENDKSEINPVNKLLKEFQKANHNLSTEKQVVNNLYIGILINFLTTQFHYTSPSLDYDFNFFFFKTQSIRDYVLDFFKNLTHLKTDFGEYQFVSNDRFKKLGIIVPKFINTVEKFVKTKIFTFNTNNPYLFKLPLTEETDNDFKIFINLYLQIKGLTGFLEFGWPSLSTGQQSFLSFMSRFYHEKHHSVGKNQIKKNLLIMIDEGDAGFHPEWQKQFFNNSLNFLSDLFVNHNLQLIYTSNTPYIISDLPRHHITFIENKEKEVKVIGKDNSLEETFAQNIHTLLSNSFFLEKGLIGEFAKNKINDLINYLNEKKCQINTNTEAQSLINVIGEPILKKQLQLMLNRRQNAVLKKEIKNLKTENIKLKSKLRKK